MMTVRKLLSVAWLSGAAAIMASAAHAANATFSVDDGLRVDGSGYQWVVGGRIQGDSAWFDDNASPSPFDDSNADLRRARIRSQLTIEHDWRLVGDYDVGGVNTGWKNVYAQYRGWRHWRITAGNQIAPFSMAEMSSSNTDAFMEQSIATAMNPSLLLGVAANTWGHGWTLAGGYFWNELSHESQRKSNGEGAVTRFTVSPIAKKGALLHFGIAAEYRKPNDDDLIRIRTRPESYMTNVRLVNTGNIQNVDDTVLLGAELAIIGGPLTLQGEYMHMAVNRSVGSDLDFSGWYASVSYLLTGETRGYSRSRGVIEGPRRIKHGWGALEAAVRYGKLDLEDQDIAGGKETNYAGALNWYINDNARFSLNYIVFDASPTSGGIDEDGHIISVRLQYVL